jgi:hypothetical protein
MKTRILSIIALAALPVIGSGAGTGVGPSTSPGTLSPAAQPSATAQAPGTTMPAPGTPNNSINNTNNSNAQGGVNGSGVNGDRDVNGEGRGVYLDGTYYRNGTFGYNTNLGTSSGYANTNSFYWTTNPPEPRDQHNTTRLPGNALPTPITLPSAPAGSTALEKQN